MNIKISSIPGILIDLILPDHCSICGTSLALNRNHFNYKIPLCSNCMLNADNSVFSINYPAIRRCITCGYPLTSEEDKCGRCREKTWNFRSSLSIYLYTGIIKELIRAYKFDNRKNLSFYFAEKIYDIYMSDFTGYTIIPVPYRPRAKHKRGWDQIQIICRILKHKYNLPVDSCMYRKNGPAQKSMTFTQRLHNLRDKIGTKNVKIPKKILLIDDVFTTGATMDYCAEILMKVGCEDVRCLALALDL